MLRLEHPQTLAVHSAQTTPESDEYCVDVNIHTVVFRNLLQYRYTAHHPHLRAQEFYLHL